MSRPSATPKPIKIFVNAAAYKLRREEGLAQDRLAIYATAFVEAFRLAGYNAELVESAQDADVAATIAAPHDSRGIPDDYLCEVKAASELPLEKLGERIAFLWDVYIIAQYHTLLWGDKKNYALLGELDYTRDKLPYEQQLKDVAEHMLSLLPEDILQNAHVMAPDSVSTTHTSGSEHSTTPIPPYVMPDFSRAAQPPAYSFGEPEMAKAPSAQASRAPRPEPIDENFSTVVASIMDRYERGIYAPHMSGRRDFYFFSCRGEPDKACATLQILRDNNIIPPNTPNNTDGFSLTQEQINTLSLWKLLCDIAGYETRTKDEVVTEFLLFANQIHVVTGLLSEMQKTPLCNPHRERDNWKYFEFPDMTEKVVKAIVETLRKKSPEFHGVRINYNAGKRAFSFSLNRQQLKIIEDNAPQYWPPAMAVPDSSIRGRSVYDAVAAGSSESLRSSSAGSSSSGVFGFFSGFWGGRTGAASQPRGTPPRHQVKPPRR